jgi:hypothetical protein
VTEAPPPIDGEILKARCGDCDHVWVVAYLPQTVERAAKLAIGARCPRGCTGKVLVA